jgi:SPOR domain
MTQSDARQMVDAGRSALDLNEVERQLADRTAQPHSKADPLAELARLVADGEQGSRANASNVHLDDLFEDFLRGAAPSPLQALNSQPVAVEPLFTTEEFNAASVHAEPVDAAEQDFDADVGHAEQQDFVASVDQDRSSQPQSADGQFNDMLAEFEAAMRDAGASPQLVSSDSVSATAPEASSYAGAGLIAAGVGAAAATGAAVAYKRPPRRGMLLAGGVIGVAVIGVASLFAFTNGNRSSSGSKPVPTIAAVPGVTKERPANPGGTEMPNQDREVLQARQQPVTLPQRVAPREEQPLDLTTAQRQAETQPAVRQIPGVAIVAPVSTTPPAGVPAPSGARPVASVPITIVGQPPAPVASAPVAPAPMAAVPKMVVPSLPPVAAPTAAAPRPAATVPTSSPSPATAATTEPRRVRAVPIRSENGEAPSRAQTQPRVVTARGVAPASEPDEANAPLSLTPTRAAPAQRNSAPATTQSASTSGNFAVQVAAEGSEEAARSKFGQLRTRYSGVLSGMSPNIRSAEVNGRSVYRVRVGSMSRDEAVSLCERLKSSGGSCFVARN